MILLFTLTFGFIMCVMMFLYYFRMKLLKEPSIKMLAQSSRPFKRYVSVISQGFLISIKVFRHNRDIDDSRTRWARESHRVFSYLFTQGLVIGWYLLLSSTRYWVVLNLTIRAKNSLITNTILSRCSAL